MNKRLYPGILIGIFTLAAIFTSGCAHKEKVKESIYPEGKLYHQPYDKVWDTVNNLIFTDLGCVENKVDKKKGYIETEWATQLTAEGTSRWRIAAHVKQKNDSTLVLFYKEIEEREVVNPNKPGAKEKSKDEKEGNPKAGWKHGSDESSDADNLYQQLEKKLH